MGERYAPALVAGVALWGALTVACSAVDGSSDRGPAWGGTIRGAESPEPRGRPLAVSWHKGAGTDTVYRVNPRTMKLRHPLRLHARGTMDSDLAADGSILIATAKDGVRVLDPEATEVGSSNPATRWVREVVWVDDDVAILVADVRGKTKLVRFRPSTGAVLDTKSFDGTFFTTADTGDGIVLLAYGYDPDQVPKRPGPATLAVMDAAGELATIELDEVGAGHYEGPGGGATARALPALAVKGSVATVVGTDGTIVSVDLATLEETVEGGDGSLLDRLAAWFVPPAHAKTFDGTELRAEWAGDALLVSGYGTTDRETRPAGAVLLDPDDWSATVVDEEAYGARMAGDRLLTWKTFMVGDDRGEGIGLRAYGPDGELEWQTLDGEFVTVQEVHGDVAFVEHGWSDVLVSSIDLDTGKLMATRHAYVNFLSL